MNETAQLILTVTRACNLRCSYCPTAKDGWPSLSVDDAIQAVDLFAARFPKGDVKLFGGEPLLVPDVVRAAIERAHAHDGIRRVQLNTNGLGLDASWIDALHRWPKLVLTLSIDGKPDDHRRYRRALLETVPDAYAHLETLREALVAAPRVVVTQTIPPATAGRAFDNFGHLWSLGYRRFNFLPGYYLAWSDRQLASLREGFDAIGRFLIARWNEGERVYVRNLFTWAPTPFFNTGMVVDSDRTIHPTNVGLSGALESLLEQTRVGDLDTPPTNEALSEAASRTRDILEATLEPHVWSSTHAVDAELTRLCDRITPAYVAHVRRRRAA